jgi:hypothetical protein
MYQSTMHSTFYLITKSVLNMENEKFKNLEEFAKQLKIRVNHKIKFIEKELKEVITPYIPTESANHRSDSQYSSPLTNINSEKVFNETAFSLVEKYSNKIGQLIYMRSRINDKNALEVNRILDTEEYTRWSKSRLRIFFTETTP